MDGLFVLIILIIIGCVLIPNTTRPKVLELFKSLGKDLGFNATALSQVTSKVSKFSMLKESIEGYLSNRKLKIQIEEVSSGDAHYWKFKATWFCENKHKLKMTLFREGVFSKVRKKFGMQDIEIFNENFDNKFIIQSNFRHFPLQMFSAQFCDNLLKEDIETGRITISGAAVQYTENICLDDEFKCKRLKTLIIALQELAELVEVWSPTYRLDKRA